MTIIELKPEDAKLFILFQRYREQFEVLLRDGILDDFIGSAVIHKDGKSIRITQKTVTLRH